MTNNKMEVYAYNITNLVTSHTGSFTAIEVAALDEIRSFLFSLSDLFGREVVQQQAVQPVQVPAAPGAVQISSGVAPQVEGCVAAQPNTIMQQVAQQRLNQLLAEQEAEKKAKQDAFNQALVQTQTQDALTASFLGQMQNTAPVAPAVAPAAREIAAHEIAIPTPASAEEKEMTLADFVAMQKRVDESLQTIPAQAPAAPQGEMTLADFVKSQQAQQPKSSVDLQAQLNAELAAQQSIQPGASSPLA